MARGTEVRDICVNKSFVSTLEAMPEVAPHRGPLRNSEEVVRLIQGARALEIGGPTPDPINVYEWLGSCDNAALYADVAHRRPELREAAPFAPAGRVLGRYVVANADNLTDVVPRESYDVLYASHVLEHLRDPLGALLSWTEVLRPRGVLFLILPWKNATFDRFRAPNTLEQLAQKFVRKNDDNLDALAADFEQTVRAVDVPMDYGFPPGSTSDDLRRRTLGSPEGSEMLHWHVFDFHLLRELFRCLNLRVVTTDLIHPFHQFIVGVKQA